VLIIGMASKNAILIVELASELRTKGTSIFDSAVGLRKCPVLLDHYNDGGLVTLDFSC
jgi:multidrug efflux pump subunit AcrB